MKVLDYQTFCPQGTSAAERKRLHVGDIFANQAKCLKCEEVIRSRNRHDFVTCICGNLSVDGGSGYFGHTRRVFRDGRDSFEDMNILYDDIKEE